MGVAVAAAVAVSAVTAVVPVLVSLSSVVVSMVMGKHSDAVLRGLEFTPTLSDPRIYVKLNGDGTKLYIAVHVDDFGIAASNKTLMKEAIAQTWISISV